MKNFQLYLVYVYGVIIAFIGLLLLLFYFSFNYLSPIIEDFLGVQMNLTNAMLIISISFTLIGFFFGIYAISKINSFSSKFIIILSFLFSIISFVFQLYKLTIIGPTWIGIELFGTYGNKIEAMYVSAIVFLISFLSLVISASILFIEIRGEK
ncbi:MAG: hypothetical protein H0Z24_00240 [Thermosipho sp. (in: Bacteria)]|nr:hypothetical protein [Thermosipho sp. (in: thermotogales)]